MKYELLHDYEINYYRKEPFLKNPQCTIKLQIYLNSTKIYSNNMSDRMTLFSHEKA